MEVTTEDDAQAVLLESMDGAQYITIQRADGESLGKALFTLNGELISEGMVVDMISGVGQDYATNTQYYETDELLPQVLTEEDRRLAAALVAVQLQQQQKQQQQMHNHPNLDEVSIQDVTHLESLGSVDSCSIETNSHQNPTVVYPTLLTCKRGQYNGQSVKQEFVNVKCEDDVDISAESSEDAITIPGSRRSLPHKKRIPHKLKQHSKKNSTKRDSNRLSQDGVVTEIRNLVNVFKCELCGNKCNGQLAFFEHLKSHYEPMESEKRAATQTVNEITTAIPNVQESPESSVQGVVEHVIEEFSEPEDIMEGIRSVVEETGAHIDDDDDEYNDDLEDDVDNNVIPDPTNSSSMWTISEMPDQVEEEEVEHLATINTGVSPKNDKIKSPKKKKADELTCPHCDRSFYHKNSLDYHLRSHSGERPHQCEVCGKSFFAASALKVHKRLHSGDKPYKCEDCGRHFRQWGDLKYHCTSLHSVERQFQCEYCGKDFARKYSLIVHRRIHTGEKNYRCEYCNKSFRASSYLQNHRRIHTGEKPHPCDVCGKPFRVRSDMKRHMLTHSRSMSVRLLSPKNTPILKNVNSNSGEYDGLNKASRTINEIVHELKLEVGSSSAVVELVGDASVTDDSESILPHVGIQALGYTTVASTQAGVDDRSGDGVGTDHDPLDSISARNDAL
ncbi:hypothetical protein QAD02_012306 [Eretmocerus hayati]|uniref:Uncharacterized protein n=1 Tax=Eretmocerus hayati TaxID=131215 RepID=A0ACC2P1W8_9HYME|nr:hypothetical protein QAD02_012306 [Eretmocerus hayati]